VDGRVGEHRGIVRAPPERARYLIQNRMSKPRARSAPELRSIRSSSAIAPESCRRIHRHSCSRQHIEKRPA
jgi:hypothetical protein